MKNNKRGNKDFLGGVEKISKLIADDNFIKERGPYIRMGDHLVFPKMQQISYEQLESIDVEQMTRMMLTFFDKDKLPNNLEHGLVYILPYPTNIAVPTPYHAIHYNPEEDELFFSTFVNYVANYGKEDKPQLLGSAFILCGKLSKNILRDTEKNINKCIDYLNSDLTAYRLVRHDHNVSLVTLQKLPSVIKYYTFKMRPRLEMSSSKETRYHFHDLMDVWSKRFPDTKKDMEDFIELSSHLPVFGSAKYLLNLMVDSITSYCLGDFENAILDSDRYAELAIRYIFKYLPGLKNKDLSKYRALYSKRKPDTGALNIVLAELSLTEIDEVDLWQNKSRRLRNDITHKLKFDSISRLKAMDALKHNLRLVRIIAEKVPEPDWTIKMLIKGDDTFQKLFGE